jgi:hypothetical protein
MTHIEIAWCVRQRFIKIGRVMVASDSSPRRPRASALAVLAIAVACIGLAPTTLQAIEECDCRHRKALQDDLRNALYLQEAFRGKFSELRSLELCQRLSKKGHSRCSKNPHPRL